MNVLVPIEITLKRAPDDPPANSPEFQKELRQFADALRAADVDFSQRAIAFDAVDATGYPLAEFVVRALAVSALPSLTAIVVALLKAKNGRKVRLKFGSVDATAPSVEEVERLLKLVPTLPPEAASKESLRLAHTKQRQVRATAFSKSLSGKSDEELFRAFRAVQRAKTTAVVEGESEDLILKGVLAEVEIIKRHPKEKMKVYRAWEKSQT